MKKKLFIKTFGCQMNVYDSDRMKDLLSPLGFETTDLLDDADFTILNTCHIREKAEQKVYSDLGRINIIKKERQKQGKDMIIAVAGCVAQAEGREILRQAPYVNMVFGPQTYHQLPEMLAELMRKKDQDLKGSGRGVVNVDFPKEDKFDSLILPEKSPVSAFLSIQEGCDKFCKFCVVPYTRGAEFSRPFHKVVAEAKKLVELGAREITVLGQNVSAYHGEDEDGKEHSLADLLYTLAEINGLDRLRYTTSHPCDMQADLIKAHGAIPKLMPFLHLPVQSGSDSILKNMNRKHDRNRYFELIQEFKNARPDIAFSSDFIVGYPGETDEDFEQTLDLVRKVNFAQCYSFMYSKRPGTPAAANELQVPDDIKAKRLQTLQALLAEQQQAFNSSKIDTEQDVLLDRTGKKEGQLLGKSAYLQSVVVEAPKRLLGQIVTVKIKKATLNSLTGDIMAVNGKKI
ncbi:MAG: tRNA (N6-isopentenyl adenosine(37)-C2)-methylthiotransferase MiaB [Alphaproteobacteria bacterium CG_4_10_14_0_8_um_filter_37_21]|nr:MAG: tRNA (N6-isopentenyl adenosine(37)-C2)-methylthiotransferase MiaB [Alphaproteobacteria bacterium CG_4_10_14_0_8_um_filter_37_21]